ncbi:MAG: hypothetical protein ACLFN0_01810 [Thermovirgaceae bacterium]
MEKYVHTQNGWGLRILLGVTFLFIVYNGWRSAPEGMTPYGLIGVAGTLVGIIMVLFTSMTVRVTEETLDVSMGPGFIRKRIPLDQIESLSVKPIPWYSMGLKKIEGGWLYCVGPSKGLELLLTTGQRYIVATNDLEGLKSALPFDSERYRERETG